jgi:hypothetical protein
MNKIDVFISYKREERTLTDKLVSALNAAGYVVATDLDIEPNINFIDAIQTMIDNARATLVLWTKLSVQSEWVRTEARRALKLDKNKNTDNIYRGVLLEKIDLPMDFDAVNMIDFSDDGLTDKAIKEILVHLQKELKTTSATDARDAKALSSNYAAELQAFYTADQLGEVIAFQGFIKSYPNSFLIANAKKRISEIDQVWPRLVRKTLTVGGIGTLCAVIGVLGTIATMKSSDPGQPADIVALQTQIQSQTKSLSNLNDQLLIAEAEYQKNINKYVSENAGLRDSSEQLNISLSDAISARENAQNDVRSLGVQINKLKKDLKDLRAKVAAAPNTVFSTENNNYSTIANDVLEDKALFGDQALETARRSIDVNFNSPWMTNAISACSDNNPTVINTYAAITEMLAARAYFTGEALQGLPVRKLSIWQSNYDEPARSEATLAAFFDAMNKEAIPNKVKLFLSYFSASTRAKYILHVDIMEQAKAEYETLYRFDKSSALDLPNGIMSSSMFPSAEQPYFSYCNTGGFSEIDIKYKNVHFEGLDQDLSMYPIMFWARRDAEDNYEKAELMLNTAKQVLRTSFCSGTCRAAPYLQSLNR